MFVVYDKNKTVSYAIFETAIEAFTYMYRMPDPQNFCVVDTLNEDVVPVPNLLTE